MDEFTSSGFSRRIDVSDFGRYLKMQGKAFALWLTFFYGILLAQPAPFQSPSPSQAPPATYNLPEPLPTSAVSSEEFERLIGLHSLPNPDGQIRKVPDFPAGVVDSKQQQPIVPVQEMLSLGGEPVGGQHPTQSPAEAPTYFANTIPWWQERCLQPILTAEPNKVFAVQLEELVWLSMQNSPKVQSILITPKIQRTDIQIAQGEFDRRRFGQTNYHDTSSPVGNTLTTGGPSRLNEQFWENSFGIRDKNRLGGKAELSQMFNARDNNSLFFKPNNQADTKLSLNYTQPLLRGAGMYYNTSSIRIAGLKTDQRVANANRELQDHTREVISTYWELVLQRYLLEQARNGQNRLKAIKQHLQNRSGTDLISTQISRASASISNQQGQIETAKASIYGLQESLRRLVNSPELAEENCIEILPLTMPAVELPEFPLEDELIAALTNRGDILAIQEDLQIAVVQKNLAINELKQQLDLETTTYVQGLRGNNQFAESFGDQFSKGRPSLVAGLTGSFPVGNRSAKAARLSRDLEIAKLQLDYTDKLNKARTDIKSAIVNAQATYATTEAAIAQTIAQKEEVDGHKVKFEDYMGENPSTSNILTDLIYAENQLIIAENSWANKQVQHMLALINIKYESGTLMTISAEP
jgi:outer membrane protein TolC